MTAPVDVDWLYDYLIGCCPDGHVQFCDCYAHQAAKGIRALAAERDALDGTYETCHRSYMHALKSLERVEAENAALKAADKFTRDQLERTNKIWDDLAAENAALKKLVEEATGLVKRLMYYCSELGVQDTENAQAWLDRARAWRDGK